MSGAKVVGDDDDDDDDDDIDYDDTQEWSNLEQVMICNSFLF